MEQVRHVSSISIVLSLAPLDPTQPGYQPPLDPSLVKPFEEHGFRSDDEDEEERRPRGRRPPRTHDGAGSAPQQRQQRPPQQHSQSEGEHRAPRPRRPRGPRPPRKGMSDDRGMLLTHPAPSDAQPRGDQQQQQQQQRGPEGVYCRMDEKLTLC